MIRVKPNPKDPRIPLILSTLESLLDPSGSDRDGGSSPGANIEGSPSSSSHRVISLQSMSEAILSTLDTWLIKEGLANIRAGLPRPRVYGFAFCDCTKALNELLLGTVEAIEPTYKIEGGGGGKGPSNGGKGGGE